LSPGEIISKKKIKAVGSLVIIVFSVLVSRYVYAEDAHPLNLLNGVMGNTDVPDPASEGITMGGLLVLAVNLMIGVGFTLAIITSAYAMIEYATSAGDADKVSNAGRTLRWAVISALVTAGSIGIKTAFFGALGADAGVTDVITNI
jgi:hypothetical protein